MLKAMFSGGAGYIMLATAALGFWQGAKWQKNTQAAKDLKIERLEHAQELTNKQGEIDALALQISAQQTAAEEAEKTRKQQNEKFSQQRYAWRRDLADMQKHLSREKGDFYDTSLPYNTIARFNCAAHGIMCELQLAGADTSENNNQESQGEGGNRRDATDPTGRNDNPNP